MDFLGEAIIARHEIAVRGLANPVDQAGFDEWMEEFVAGVMSGFWRVGQREMERVRCEQGAPFALQMCAVAGPAVVGRMFNHAGADRVRFDVTLACRQPGGAAGSGRSDTVCQRMPGRAGPARKAKEVKIAALLVCSTATRGVESRRF